MKKYELTDEHRAQLKPWADKWIANALSTAPMTEQDKEICRAAVLKLYKAANEPPPKAIVFVPSPFVMQFSAGIAAAILYQQRTGHATQTATEAATRDATRAATWAATQAATRAATWAATWAATRVATRDATRAATQDATAAATRDATQAATQTATRAATLAATLAATQAATQTATRDATAAATQDALFQTFKNNWYRFGEWTKFLPQFWRQCSQKIAGCWQGGNQWSSYDSYLSFFRHVAKLKLEYDSWDAWETLSLHSGPRIVHADFCIVSDRPCVLKINAQNQPHCASGPFCQWRDGSALFALNGVYVPAWVVENPELINGQAIMAETNVEVRREMLRLYGIERFVQDTGATTLDKSGNYELLSVDLGGERGLFLKMLNPSIGVWHVEGVPNHCRTVEQANHERKPEALRKIPISYDGEDWFQQGDVCIWPRHAKTVKPNPVQLT